MQVVRLGELADRSDYQKAYYKAHKAQIKANYNAQTQYVKWVEVKKALTNLKRKIGSVNYDLILDELEKLERKKSS